MEIALNYLNSIHLLSPGLTDYLQAKMGFRKIERKEYLLHEGQVCRRVHFIQKGLLRCFYHRYEQEVCSWFMKEGDVIISVESFYQQKSSYESIQALEECELYFLDYRDLEWAYRTYHEFNYIGRVLTQKYYCLSEQRLYSMRMQRSQERYDYLLQHHADLALRVPAKYIASYLGITEVTLSRIKGQ